MDLINGWSKSKHSLPPDVLFTQVFIGISGHFGDGGKNN